MRSIRGIRVKDYELSRVQEGLITALNQVLPVQIIDGVLLENIEIGTSSTNVEHRLNRQPLGWIVVDKQGTGDIHRTAWNSSVVELESSVAVIASIWIF